MSEPTREVELKARVDDVDATRRKVEASGGVLVFEGWSRDRIYDTADRALSARDNVLRLRSCESKSGVESAHVDWKGPTSHENGFKVRSELTAGVTERSALSGILGRLGYEVVGEIDREIAQYELGEVGAGKTIVTVRFERYPRMDTLMEIEGPPAAIERVITELEIPRNHFTADKLADFVRSFEMRTGQRAAICESAL